MNLKKQVYLTNYSHFVECFSDSEKSPQEIILDLQEEVNTSGTRASHLVPYTEYRDVIFDFSHENELGIYYTYWTTVS